MVIVYYNIVQILEYDSYAENAGKIGSEEGWLLLQERRKEIPEKKLSFQNWLQVQTFNSKIKLMVRLCGDQEMILESIIRSHTKVSSLFRCNEDKLPPLYPVVFSIPAILHLF